MVVGFVLQNMQIEETFATDNIRLLQEVAIKSQFLIGDFVHLLFWQKSPAEALVLSIILTTVLNSISVDGAGGSVRAGTTWQNVLDTIALLPDVVGGTEINTLEIGIKILTERGLVQAEPYNTGVYISPTELFYQEIRGAYGWDKYSLDT